MISRKIVVSNVILISLFAVSQLFAHCQIPCGIYTDDMRFHLIEEHIRTIEKSMNQISELSKASPISYNQLVRWIQNKDEHAQKIQDIVHAYFMTQRVKPAEMKDEKGFKEYTKKLTLLHQLLFYAMKTKQTTELSHVEKLKSVLAEFHDAYFGPEMEQHMRDHHQK
jgi:nickel superoxide dismutase